MPRLFHRLGKEHEQARHQGKDREHAEQNGLDEHDTHVKADAELHEHHGGQARDGGEAAGGDGGDGGADRRDAGLPVPGVLPLLQEAVEHDDGVVDGQGQLQHHGHRVGHKGDLSEDEIRPQVQHRRRKSEQQHRDLRVRAGGEQQHQHDDHRRHRQDNSHLTGQGIRLGITHGAVDVVVIGLQQLPDGGQGGEADLVLLLPVKGHGDQGVRSLEILRDVLRRLRFAVLLRVRADIAAPKGGRGDSLDLLHLLRQVLRHLVGYMGDHNSGGGKGGKLLLHEGQPLAGLRALRQILRDVVADADPAPGKQAENQSAGVEKEDEIALIHNECGQLFKKGRCSGVFAHNVDSS